jgi:hypothetical protein
MEKLLNIEKKITENSFKSKLKIIGEFGCTSYCWKALNE